MQISIPQSVQTVLAALNRGGFAAYVVGGCVRDCLMGQAPHDWDITTSALPEQTRQALAAYPVYDTGIRHGTVTAVADGLPIEVTTFRMDGSYSDRRRPDSVSFTDDLKTDLSRRDFTVNAMAYCPQEGLVDCFGGTADIKNRCIRCVGEPDIRFGEDALRILRALRFASVLDFSITEETAESLLHKRDLLRAVAAERIGKELLQLLCGRNAESVFTRFAPVFFVWIPELEPCLGFAQHTPYHCYDVYTHTAKSVALSPAVPELRMAMLLHDIAKPACHTTDAQGRDHFHGHAVPGAALAQTITKRLRCSKAFCERVTRLVALHDIRIHRSPELVPRLLGELGEEVFMQLLVVMRADCAAKSPLARKEQLPVLESIEAQAKQLCAQNSCLRLSQLAVNGADLLALGIPQGERLGTVLQQLLDAVLRGEVANKKSALLSLTEQLI